MSGPDRLPPGGVRALLATDYVTEPTRQALQAKLDARYDQPRFFTAHEHRTLQALCDRLIPQAPERRVDIAGGLDARLADGMRDGWRYDVLPPDEAAYRLGLLGLDQTAEALFRHGFADLGGQERDEVIRRVAEERPIGPAWDGLPPDPWFEGVLVEVSEIFFAHPCGYELMGYVGMADAQGWSATGLDEDEPPTAADDHAA